MQKSILLIITVLIINICFCQTKKPSLKKEKLEDKIEKYYFVMIKTGAKQDFDSTEKQALFKGHMDNINKLYYDGILKVAGPFEKNDLSWRGIFIFDCKSKEEAEQYVQKDPAIAAGLLAVDIVPWYSSPIGSFKHGKPKKP